MTLSAPATVNVTPLNDTAVNVTWSSPNNTNGIDVFYAYTNETQKKYCEVGKDETTCEIKELTAYTPYNVCVVACHRDYPTTIEPTMTPTGAGDAMADDAYFEVYQFLADSSEDESDEDHFCSIPTCEIVQTLPIGVFTSIDFIHSYFSVIFCYFFPFYLFLWVEMSYFLMSTYFISEITTAYI